MPVHKPSTDHAPAVSIGVPVFNGERYLEQTLDSLLGQTFTDLEIIVSDNASTDGTRAICESFASRDSRVRYVLQSINIGAPRNWNVVVHAARGRYFKWASANDYCSPNFLEECVKLLDADPKVVVAFGTTMLVDEETGEASEYKGDIEVTEPRPSDRFRRVTRVLALNNAQSGLLRLDVLRKTGLDRPYVGGDLTLMAELALHGQFRRAPSATLFRRVGKQTLSMHLSEANLHRLIDPLSTHELGLVAWPRHLDRFATALRSPIGTIEKLRCLGTTSREFFWDRIRLVHELRMLIGLSPRGLRR